MGLLGTIIIGDDSHRSMYEEAAGRVQSAAAEVSQRGSDEATNRTLAEIKRDGTYQRLYERFEQLPPGGNILEA